MHKIFKWKEKSMLTYLKLNSKEALMTNAIAERYDYLTNVDGCTMIVNFSRK